MAFRDVKTVTRTITISDITPEEMASIFGDWFADQQGAFFNALAIESKDWPGCGFAGQSYAITQHLDEGGRKIVDDIIDNCKAD